MPAYNSIAWLLLGITCVLACLCLNSRIRRNLRWGRTGTSIPMSVMGAITWVAAFAVLTATAFEFLPFVMIFLPLPMLVCAALYDSWRDSWSVRRQAEGSTGQKGQR